MNYTPGPWAIGFWSGSCNKESHKVGRHPGPQGDDPCVYDPLFVDSTAQIASMSEPGKMVVSSTYDGLDVRIADAHLIAAAPDLLEALKWYVENDDTNIGMEGNEFWEAGLERGKAALAKATGNQGTKERSSQGSDGLEQEILRPSQRSFQGRKEPSMNQEKKPEASIGVTMYAGTALELMDDGTLQVLSRYTKETINLGSAKKAMEAMQEALDRLKIHVK